MRAAWNGYCGLDGDAASRAPEDFTDWVVTLGTTGFGAGPLPWLRSIR